MCIAAANYIIKKTNEYNTRHEYKDQISLTCKRLQKLLFFSNVIYMKDNNGESMFEDDFYAWPSGPVIPSVYYKFVQYQDGTMHPISEEGHSPLNGQMIEAIDYVLNKTCNMDTLDLVDLSHTDNGPWQQFYDDSDPNHNQIIQEKVVFDFYKTREVFN